MTIRKHIAPLKHYVTHIPIAAALVLVPIFAGSLALDRADAQAAVQTRAFSCAGFDFHPIDSQTTYLWAGRMKSRWNDDGDGWFMCPAHLPHRAVVKQVRFTLNDIEERIDVRYCALIRTPLTVNGAIQVLAVVANTGMDAKPGTVRRSDTSISFASVDNANYAYSLQCQIFFDDSLFNVLGKHGIIGADVTYTISAANG